MNLALEFGNVPLLSRTGIPISVKLQGRNPCDGLRTRG
jgi:hypothetical protein